MDKHIVKWGISLLLIFLALGGFYVLYDELLRPAYLSMKIDCSVTSVEEIHEVAEDYGVEIGGYYNLQTDEIVVFNDDPIIRKHELCHRYQAQKGRWYPCSNKIGKYLNEVECYLIDGF